MKSRKRKKLKPFRATKEVRRLARLRMGSPPPSHRHESSKGKPPKHRKRDVELDYE